MITITRNQARQLRAVFRRCGIKPTGHSSQRVHFSAGSDGLRVRATELDVAVEYHAPCELPAEEFSLPLEFLDRCEAKLDDPVMLELRPRNLVLVEWTDGGVPQQVHYDAKPATKPIPFPAVPEQFTDVDPSIWSALALAKETVDQETSRYALACIQLRGSKGEIVTTDGRQVLFQGGFQFPWTDDLLIPAPTVLGWRELVQSEGISIGRTEDNVALRLGPWTILLRINKDGRFPRVDDALPAAETIKSRLLLNDSDAEFLLQVLPRLPSDDDLHNPVTLDLNGQVAVRSKQAEGRPTEVVLSGSKLSGEPLLISTNRQYLMRAMKLGFREIGIADPAAPMVCRDQHRQYGWMSLGDADAIQSSDDAIRIASPTPGAEAVPVPKTSTRNRSKMTETSTVHNSDSAPNQAAASETRSAAATATPAIAGSSKRLAQRSGNRKATKQTAASPIEQAVALRASLIQTLSQASELIRTLKRHKKQNRLVASTLKSLKELQQAG